MKPLLLIAAALPLLLSGCVSFGVDDAYVGPPPLPPPGPPPPPVVTYYTDEPYYPAPISARESNNE